MEDNNLMKQRILSSEVPYHGNIMIFQSPLTSNQYQNPVTCYKTSREELDTFSIMPREQFQRAEL